MTIMEDLVLYKRRWVFVLGLFAMLFFSGISFSSYGQVSSFYVQFFRVSHLEVDWITNARNTSPIIITFPLAWLIFKGKIGLRNMILIVAGSSTLGLFFVLLSLTHHSLFPLIITGQILCGLSEVVGVAIPSTFAALWFRESQVGTAILLIMLGFTLGDAVGYILPAALVSPLNDTVQQEQNLTLSDISMGQRHLQYMYGIFLTISAAVTILFAIFVTDKPPTPPTHAQNLKEKGIQVVDKSRNFVQLTKLLFSNVSYIFICIDIGLAFQLVILENMMMAEIIRNANLSINATPEKLSGYMMSLFSLAGVPGLIIGGKIVDHYKKYKILGILGNFAMFLSTALIAVSVLYKNTPGIFVGNALFGFSVGAIEVVLMEIATQLTYPIDETLVNTWMTGIQTLVGFLLGIFGRFIYKSYKSIGLLSFQCACAFMGLVLVCLISSKNRRLEVEPDDNNDPSDRTPLIDHK
uniref:Feline leukemia virus subgroup C receptor-related protein 2-like n=1 Tax=Phallusia mammillata TaxID=59560 RepID=A0A6F9DDQ8_9ASCI|nr:feline leukemia virus subgroup C receptor-related protein 2-like [Phallusia mammillata]